MTWLYLTCWPRRPWRVAQYALIGKAFQKQKQMILVGETETQGEPYDGLEMGSCFFSSGRTHVKLQCAQPCTRLMAVRQSLSVSKIQMAVGKWAESRFQRQWRTKTSTWEVWTCLMPWLGIIMCSTKPLNGTRCFFFILLISQWWTVSFSTSISPELRTKVL